MKRLLAAVTLLCLSATSWAVPIVPNCKSTDNDIVGTLQVVSVSYVPGNRKHAAYCSVTGRMTQFERNTVKLSSKTLITVQVRCTAYKGPRKVGAIGAIHVNALKAAKWLRVFATKHASGVYRTQLPCPTVILPKK